ncbi:FAD/NAD(P)-binding domain-containing protein [Annulohypoxylon truncatum]|uniref:FAD/NAD(P)-binding domain-containing protein n=1 Tax=Annulohypoxylon truncatum TaxID=327061 RepID=UPI0020072008|nr:FAD/NAD(P)-binding domain-containing protein [Annulohypoxylon truncatum]KAI1205320.1 FAD/NAD(P)-binding domain-containing protein [Annulohypoxylon truncatum]
MAKNVCIVGAGPSGLVAAKTLLHDASPGSYHVAIFEAQSRIGGLWPTNKDDVDGLVHPLMVTNQSKHTVQFSDLAWRDSDPQFPRAWQVGQYLERYLSKYGGANIRLDHKVVKADLQGDGSWKVETESAGVSKTDIFDYLLVTTGFFGKPIWPEYVPKEADVPIIHSSKYRDLKGLLKKSNRRGGKILVIGGQMSGIEISATIATHLSSAVHSSGDKVIEEPDKYSIHHVVQRPSWVFPLFTSPKPASPAPPFLPCDLPSYNLANRPHPLTNTQGHISVETARIFNSLYQTALGTNQSEFSSEAKIDGNLLDEQPFLAMSQFYSDFVRSGLIKISKGKLSSLSGNTATISANEQISDIAAVVLATGFDPSPSLSFLPSSVLETISFSPSHPNLPVALAFHGTHHPSLPTLGFVGMYRSPYWGVMEMQARFMARLWTAPNTPTLKDALTADDSIARTLSLRADPRTSQFPMGDYTFLMQDFARALSIPIIPFGDTPPLGNGKAMDILTPTRYPYPSPPPEQQQQQRQEEITANLRATRETAIAGLSHARFVAGAVFRSLLGEWRLSRTLSSRLPSHPSGRFEGVARFHLREGTADGLPTSRVSEAEAGLGLGLGLEYLYEEDGTFTARDNPGLKFRATRRYVWRYDEMADKLSVWFARTDDQMRADYLFHEVEFLVPSDEDGDGKGWLAKASHLCVEDLYDVHYEFNFKAVNLREWKLGYTVQGPKKDYTIDGVYTR